MWYFVRSKRSPTPVVSSSVRTVCVVVCLATSKKCVDDVRCEVELLDEDGGRVALERRIALTRWRSRGGAAVVVLQVREGNGVQVLSVEFLKVEVRVVCPHVDLAAAYGLRAFDEYGAEGRRGALEHADARIETIGEAGRRGNGRKVCRVRAQRLEGGKGPQSGGGIEVGLVENDRRAGITRVVGGRHIREYDRRRVLNSS
jgi:hypothetical protein